MSREETAKTRKRIVDAASAEFRKQGIAATGLAEIMAAAGMTHGGFYRHFKSKDELVAETTAAAAEKLKRKLLSAASKGGIKSVVGHTFPLLTGTIQSKAVLWLRLEANWRAPTRERGVPRRVA